MKPGEQLRALVKRWPHLQQRTRDGILVLAGVESVAHERRRTPRTPRGETPEWLLPAINILKDTGGHLSIRRIARQLGISHASLSRNQTFHKARRTFTEPARKLVRVGRKIGKVKTSSK